MSDSDSEDSFIPAILSQQGGCTVHLVAPGTIYKIGQRVRSAETAALRFANFVVRDGKCVGSILMDEVEDSCAVNTAMIKQLREIPKPPEFQHLYQRSADGSPSHDVLLQDLVDPARPLTDEVSLRTRINERYLFFNGASYRENLLDFLPHSNKTVFTHGDIAPRNIMVNDSASITGAIDREISGWHPDYWEFANIQKPSADWDWMKWMDHTKPEAWDITGIEKTRRLLF
ncbi:kinase-like domain-containing protein [Xylaria digitata]|nr:kinase-like domain-containing protein [Xylaria digitata]